MLHAAARLAVSSSVERGWQRAAGARSVSYSVNALLEKRPRLLQGRRVPDQQDLVPYLEHTGGLRRVSDRPFSNDRDYRGARRLPKAERRRTVVRGHRSLLHHHRLKPNALA